MKTRLHDVLPFATLVIVTLLCFGHTINCYFHADEFDMMYELNYVHQGHIDHIFRLLLSYPAAEFGAKFFRPFFPLVLTSEYFLWGATPWLFRLVGIICQLASCMFFYLWVKRFITVINQEVTSRSATLFATLAAALFAALPFHSESVIWASNVGDQFCSALLFLALWTSLVHFHERTADPDANSHRTGRVVAIASICSFGASILFKESSVTLPLILFVQFLVISRNLATALRFSLPYFGLLSGYLLLRFAAIGTVTGGYAGSAGSSMLEAAGQRLCHDAINLAFPIHATVGKDPSFQRWLLQFLYIAAAVQIIVRCQFSSLRSTVLPVCVFSLCWISLALLPTIQIIRLTAEMAGNRAFHLAAAPLALILITLLVPLTSLRSSASDPPDLNNAKRRQNWIALSGFALGIGFVACFAGISFINNSAWVHASAQIRALKNEIERVIHGLPSDRRLVILNVPREYQGVPVCYAHTMLASLMSPPLSKSDLSKRLYSMESNFIPDEYIINNAQLQRMVAADEYSFFKWDIPTEKLSAIQLKVDSERHPLALPLYGAACLNETACPPAKIPVRNAPDSDDLENQGTATYEFSLPADFNPLAYGFVELKFSTNDAVGSRQVAEAGSITWSSTVPVNGYFSNRPVTFTIDSSTKSALIPVSHLMRWILIDPLKPIRVTIAGDSRLRSAALRNRTQFVPVLEPHAASLVQSKPGVWATMSKVPKIAFDVTGIGGATGAVLELSKRDFRFIHYDKEPATTFSGKHLATIQLPGRRGLHPIPVSMLPCPGLYEMRLAAVNDGGGVVGYLSDPIAVDFEGEPLVAGNGVNTR